MPRLVQTLGAVYELARLAMITRFGFGGRWWSWRQSTAFGSQPGLSRSHRRREILEFGRWVWRTRRFM